MNDVQSLKSGPADGNKVKLTTTDGRRSPRLSLVGGLLVCAFLLTGTVGAEAAPLSGKSTRHQAVLSSAPVLRAGDVIFTDSEAAVLRLDGVTGEVSLLAAGGELVRPCGVAISAEQTVYVADTGSLAVIAIHPATGESAVLSRGDKLGVPFGIAVNAEGEIFVANSHAVVGIDPVDGTQRTVSSGGVLKAPLGVAVGPNGDLYVADMGGLIVRIDPRHGDQSIVSAGQSLMTPVGIAVKDRKTIYVSDSTARCILQIDPRNGAQTVTSAAGSLTTPFGIAVWGESDLLVGDPDAFDLAGGILRIDRRSGAQVPVAIGSGNLVNYRCVAVVPGDSTHP